MEITVGKLAWHVHHDVLFEILTEEIKIRIDYIKNNKPKHEISARLNLLKLVENTLPIELEKAKNKWSGASTDSNKAETKHNITLTTWNHVKVKWGVEWNKATTEHNLAWIMWEEAKKKHERAYIEWKQACNQFTQEMEKLHKKECPNCTWDGTSIFPTSEV